MGNQRFSIFQAKAISDKRVSNSQLRTLAALGVYGDSDGWCFPKLSTLADDLGKSKQAVSMDIKALCNLGYVEVKKQYRPDGSQKNNLYRLIFDDIPEGGLSSPEPPLSSEVDGGLSSEVDGGLSSEVDALTTHINAPRNDPIINNDDNEKLTDEQKYISRIVNMFSEKFSKNDQIILVREWRKEYGEARVMIVFDYYNTLGKKLGQALYAMKKNLPNWRFDDIVETKKHNLGGGKNGYSI